MVSTVVISYIQHYGTLEQKEKYIKGMVNDGLIGALAITEPDAGRSVM